MGRFGKLVWGSVYAAAETLRHCTFASSLRRGNCVHSISLLVGVGLLACGESIPPQYTEVALTAPCRPPTAEQLAGSWVGTMFTGDGHQTVVLEILAMVPQKRDWAVGYRLNLPDLREEGIARLRFEPEAGHYQICFSGQICGWLLADSERGFRLVSDLDEDSPSAWEVVRLGDLGMSGTSAEGLTSLELPTR